jgi:hypothetical protein
MADVTVASLEEMEPIHEGLARRARATPGVTAFWDAGPDAAGELGRVCSTVHPVQSGDVRKLIARLRSRHKRSELVEGLDPSGLGVAALGVGAVGEHHAGLPVLVVELHPRDGRLRYA